MTKTNTSRLFAIAFFALVAILIATTYTAFGQTTTETCYHYLDGELVAIDSAATAECALSIHQNAEAPNGYYLGGWGNYYLGISEDGDVYYSRNGRRWRFWDTLTIPASAPAQEEPVEPEPVVDDISTDDNGDVDGDGIINANDQCQDSAENYNGVFDTDGCADDINTLLNFAANDLNEFWRAEFEEANITYREPRSVRAYRSSGRGSAAYNAYYSPYAHSIAYDLNLMEDVLVRQGDLAPVYILAHEWGHLVQGNLGLFNGRDTIYTELEADCLAGFYVQNLEEREMLEEGDLEEGMRQAFAVGDNLPDNHPGAHGSPRERMAAFTLGFEQGAETCLAEYEQP